jgi:hypothetical protein
MCGHKHGRSERSQDNMPGNHQARFGLTYLFNGLNIFLARFHLTNEQLYEAIECFAKQEVDVFMSTVGKSVCEHVSKQ